MRLEQVRTAWRAQKGDAATRKWGRRGTRPRRATQPSGATRDRTHVCYDAFASIWGKCGTSSGRRRAGPCGTFEGLATRGRHIPTAGRIAPRFCRSSCSPRPWGTSGTRRRCGEPRVLGSGHHGSRNPRVRCARVGVLPLDPTSNISAMPRRHGARIAVHCLDLHSLSTFMGLSYVRQGRRVSRSSGEPSVPVRDGGGTDAGTGRNRGGTAPVPGGGGGVPKRGIWGTGIPR